MQTIKIPNVCLRELVINTTICLFVFHLLLRTLSLPHSLFASDLCVKYLFAASPLNMSTEEKMEVDNRSIYVGNVSDSTQFIINTVVLL